MADDINTPETETVAKPARRMGPPRTRPRSPQLAITVDLDRIEDAIRRDSRNCMIAEAIKAVAPNLTSISVDVQSIRFTDPARNLRFIYMTPRVGQMAIIDFDRGIKPPPFTFNLRKPYQIARNTGRRANKPGRTAAQAVAIKREQREVKRHIYADSDDQPFKPPADYAEKVVRAMDDPDADLGPAVALDPPNGNGSALPVIVGGRPPRIASDNKGNIYRTRKFGLRELIA